MSYKDEYGFKFISAKIYGSQRGTSKERGHNPPAYDLEGLRAWMKDQPQLETLLKNWEESGGDRNLVPSVDRKKDELPYTFDNIQLGTWRENLDKENNKKRVAIIQLSLDDEVIGEWSGTREAGEALGIDQSNISKACRGVRATAGGYKFKFSL